MKRLRRAVLFALLFFLAAVPLGTYLLWPNDPQDHTGARASPPYLTIFLVDGLSEEVFDAELAAGRLPNLQRLIREGTFIRHGIGAFPSMTGYGYYPLITGVDAAESGILGLRWFDRRRPAGNFRAYVGRSFVEMNEDLHAEPKTLFERAGEEHSLSINSYCNRGAHRGYNTGWMFTMAKYRGHWWVADLLDWLSISDDWVVVEEQVLDIALEDLRANRPKIQWVTFVSPDTYCHVAGLGPRYPELVRKIDELIGKYRAESARLGLEEQRIYAFLSDHGVESVEKNLDLIEVLGEKGIVARRGIATKLFGGASAEGLELFDGADAVIAINGNLMNHLYLRGRDGFQTAPSRAELSSYKGVDLIALLLSTPGIEHVIARGEDGAVEVHGKGGVGFIGRNAAGYSYRYSGDDPLGYGDALAGTLPPRAWLDATHGLEYPYAVVRLHAVMTSSAAPDLAVTSARGYDLARDYELFVGNYRGGHGGLRASQLRVPYILAGPGIDRGVRVEAELAEDVGRRLFVALFGESAAAR
jgi:hypothetical protein